MSKFIDRAGEESVNRQGCKMRIIKSFSSANNTVEFESGNRKYNISYRWFKLGLIKNPCHPSVEGVGYEGVGDYSFENNPKPYKIWSNMLKRCFNLSFKHKHANYEKATVSEEWHNFQNFAKWFEENYIEGTALDKDLIIKGNKTYSPENCEFIPTCINNLFTSTLNKLSGLPVGVYINRKRYCAKITKNGKSINLGTFDTIEEAFEVYKFQREKYIKEKADEWKDTISHRAYQAMYNWIVEITD